MKLHNGWLAPNGTFYSCKRMEHFDYAHEKLNSDEVTLMVEGWIKLSAGEEVGREEPTFEQSEWLRRNKQ